MIVKPSNKLSLPRALVASMRPQFFAPVLPRLSLIVFRYSQPVLIRSAVRYLNSANHETSALKAGYSVILMAVVVYVGLAVSFPYPLWYLYELIGVVIVIQGRI
jgi:ATP-binding cassette subfamily C (CFTR/MRP) protein 1